MVARNGGKRRRETRIECLTSSSFVSYGNEGESSAGKKQMVVIVVIVVMVSEQKLFIGQ